MCMLTRRLQVLLDEERYARLAAQAARTNLSVAAVVRAAIDAAFPVRAAEMTALLVDPSRLRRARGLALIDPRSRRRTWLIRSRIDGRRSDLPYRGYADFMSNVRRPTTGRRRR